MIKELDIQGIPVRLKVSGALPIRYRNLFGRDYLMDMAKITKYGNDWESFSFSEIYDIIFTMASLAGYKGTEEQWLDMFPLPVDIFALWGEACALIRGDMETTKNDSRKQQRRYG